MKKLGFILVLVGVTALWLTRRSPITTQPEPLALKPAVAPFNPPAADSWQRAIRSDLKSKEAQELLADANLLETAFLTLSLPESVEPARMMAADFLTRAMNWEENPARPLLIIEIEALLLKEIRKNGSNPEKATRSSKSLYVAFKNRAQEELTRLRTESPTSSLLAYLESI